MPLFTQNGSLLRAGNSLRGCCCDHIEPPPPPPPPEPPGPEPPPPPIPPGDPPPFGCDCCLSQSSSGDDSTTEQVIYYGRKSVRCEATRTNGSLFAVEFALDGDHTCSDNREHGLRDEYIVGKFTVGTRPVFDEHHSIVEYCKGSLGFSAELRTFYNRYSSCTGSTVDDNARTPTTLVTYTCLQGVANINGSNVFAGQTYTAQGIPFNPNPGKQNNYTGGRNDFISGANHINPGSGRVTSAEQLFIPPHFSQHASIMSVHRLSWYHHDDYDVYLAVRCRS